MRLCTGHNYRARRLTEGAEASMADLLLTLMCDGASRVSVFDPDAPSVLELGSPNPAARIQRTGNEVELAASRGFQLLAADGETAERLVLPLDDEALVILSPRDGSSAMSLYSRPTTYGSRFFRKLGLSCDAYLTIGSGAGAQIRYRSPFVAEAHAQLSLVCERFSIADLGGSTGVFVNGRRLAPRSTLPLVPGDTVEILDLTFMVGSRFVSINDPNALEIGDIPGATLIDHALFRDACPDASEPVNEPPFFFPAPRLMHSIHRPTFQVDEPPYPQKPDDRPALMQMGPSFMMGLASVFSASTAISRIAQGGSIMSGLPSIAMCVAMLSGMVIWPIISRAYTKRRDEATERRRQARYTDYLNLMDARFDKACDEQADILRLRRPELSSLLARAHRLSPRLMNRSLDHDDFMELRVGIGNDKLDADFHWPRQKFSMEDDKLLERVSELAKHPPTMHDVPLAFNPGKHWCAGIVGSRDQVWSFARGLVVQIASLYSYLDVKLVLVADRAEEDEWSFMRALPHAFDDAGARRLTACDYDELVDVSMRLDHALANRRPSTAGVEAGSFGVHYVILCANTSLAERSDVIVGLQRMHESQGVSLLFLAQTLRDLPRECSYVIDLTARGALEGLGDMESLIERERPEDVYKGSARMFDRDDVAGTMVSFDPDILVERMTALAFALDIVRARLDVPLQHGMAVSSLGFLEMFEAGNVNQLNIAQRWSENDASRTLQTPVGRDDTGELAMLNLHEHAHGPHGLVAGTTGSGKSELIITYILSLCTNYPPDQVAFVLIDYKGGGLAGAFENERLRLPHLAGTITNLDGAAIARSLVSIESELKRRQDAFNSARDITGDATIDIYKYLRYYRQGALEDPMPHLFIIADEFAELKQQEPEFMDELISAARIGRSLGVHLILATQKPSGVVNDQIWSNARFKVCLKVSDAADSKEMIHRPDAAEINRPGQYYLLVGYNEAFSGGQAAYCGAPYLPSESFEPRHDDGVELIDDLGEPVAVLRPPTALRSSSDSELNAVLAQLGQMADALGTHAQPLWLPPLADHIALGKLREKYSFSPRGACEVILGEVDAPSDQRQFPYALDLAAVGNLIVFGAQDSGADSLVATLLLSIVEDYGPDEVSFYALDLGMGTLTPFGEAPQCGGVVISGDVERTHNLLRLVGRECAHRRGMLASAGITLEDYNARADEPLGHVVVAITNIAAFYDLYGDLEDTLVTLTRDAPRLGIHFVVTSSTANAVRGRLRANFSTSIVCAMNDEGDVLTIMGRKPKAMAARRDKHGYVMVGKELLEFQGASVAGVGESSAEEIARVARRRGAECTGRAQGIVVLPVLVHPSDMALEGVGRGAVPVGYSKRGVEPVCFSLERSPAMLVFGNSQDAISRYLRGLRECLERAATLPYLFVDTEAYLGPTDDPNVVQAPDDAAQRLFAAVMGRDPVGILAFTSIIETLAKLPADVAKQVKGYIAKEEGKGVTGIVAASEYWRCKAVYEDWYKTLSAHGDGVWVGSGFGDQSAFGYPRLLSEYRAPAARDDGFVAVRGEVDAVRLVSATNEMGSDT